MGVSAEAAERGKEIYEPGDTDGDADKRKKKEYGIYDGFPEELFPYFLDGVPDGVKFFILPFESFANILIHISVFMRMSFRYTRTPASSEIASIAKNVLWRFWRAPREWSAIVEPGISFHAKLRFGFFGKA